VLESSLDHLAPEGMANCGAKQKTPAEARVL